MNNRTYPHAHQLPRNATHCASPPAAAAAIPRKSDRLSCAPPFLCPSRPVAMRPLAVQVRGGVWGAAVSLCDPRRMILVIVYYYDMLTTNMNDRSCSTRYIVPYQCTLYVDDIDETCREGHEELYVVRRRATWHDLTNSAKFHDISGTCPRHVPLSLSGTLVLPKLARRMGSKRLRGTPRV